MNTETNNVASAHLIFDLVRASGSLTSKTHEPRNSEALSNFRESSHPEHCPLDSSLGDADRMLFLHMWGPRGSWKDQTVGEQPDQQAADRPASHTRIRTALDS